MKRELNVLVRLTATLSTALFALVAIRRVLIDLQDILGVTVRIENKNKKPLAKLERLMLLLKDLTTPAPAGGLKLGTVNEDKLKGKTATLSVAARDINPHTLIFGASSSGKTAFLASLIRQDIRNNDRALVVVDSDGDLVKSIVEWMATEKNGENYAARTIVLEPANTDCNLALNPMIADDERSAAARASGVVRAFYAAEDVNGSYAGLNPQSANILRNSILLLIANNKPITDLQTLLTDNDFRDLLMEFVTKRKNESTEYQLLLDTWGQYKKLARTDQWIVWVEPILTRLGAARADEGVMKILTGTANNINIKDVILQKQILLVKFNSRIAPKLLSGLLFAELMDAALVCEARAENKMTALYIDHLDAVMNEPGFHAITKEMSKNRIDIIGTIQNLHAMSAEFRDLLLATTGRAISFVNAQKDASLLSALFFKDEQQTLPNQKHIKESSVDERLQSQQPYEFYYHSSRTVGAVKIQAPLAVPIELAKVDQSLMKRIMKNENHLSSNSK